MGDVRMLLEECGDFGIGRQVVGVGQQRRIEPEDLRQRGRVTFEHLPELLARLLRVRAEDVDLPGRSRLRRCRCGGRGCRRRGRRLCGARGRRLHGTIGRDAGQRKRGHGDDRDHRCGQLPEDANHVSCSGEPEQHRHARLCSALRTEIRSRGREVISP
jgi:hypothetical protein